MQIRRLREFCDARGLDYHLIDNELTFSENKDFLKTQVIDVRVEKNMDVWKAKEEEYMSKHFLWHYLHCIKEGKTQSQVTVKALPHKAEFSLRAFVLKHNA